LHRAERHFEVVVETLEEGIIVLDRNGMIKSVNPAATQILGVRREDIGADFIRGTEQFPLYDENGNEIPRDERPALKVMATGVPYSGVILGLDMLSGQTKWLRSSGRLLNPEQPGGSDLLISFSDVTAEREISERLEHQATHDLLTGLPNRALVLRKIAEALASTDGNRLCAVLYIDLDDLKATNDTLGHKAGDELICAAAERLRGAVEHGDLVGRLGGDEFVVLLFGRESRGDVGAIVELLHAQFDDPAAVASTMTPIRASIGMVDVYPSDQRTAEEILRDADLAMYEAKRAGRRRGEPDPVAADSS